MCNFSECSGTAIRASTLKSAIWRPPSHVALNRLGILYCCVHRTVCPTNTPVLSVFFKDLIFFWTGREVLYFAVEHPNSEGTHALHCLTETTNG